MTSVCIVGLGYIGLPTAAVIADAGKTVLGVDIEKRVVDKVNAAATDMVEPGLNELVAKVVRAGHLRAAQSPAESDIFVIAVPTPIFANTAPDMTYVQQAVLSIAPFLRPGNLVILESTSPVGATEEMARWLAEARGTTDDIHIAYSPERILPGNMLHELSENSRVVGGLTPEATRLAAEFYRSFVRGAVTETTSRTAELTKLAENSFRDVNIAFANELSLIAMENGVDPWELIRLANCHPRVKILQPGPGVGGHCIAVDPWFLVHTNPNETRLIKAAREVNLHKTEWVYEAILKAAAQQHRPTVACLGLAYKPDTEDLRASPALDIARRLCQSGIDTVCCEPNVGALPGLTLTSLDEALQRASIVVFLVSHKQFKAIPKERLKGKAVIDSCGVLND